MNNHTNLNLQFHVTSVRQTLCPPEPSGAAERLLPKGVEGLPCGPQHFGRFCELHLKYPLVFKRGDGKWTREIGDVPIETSI